MTGPEGESAPKSEHHAERRQGDRRSSKDRRVQDVGPPDGEERRKADRRQRERRGPAAP